MQSRMRRLFRTSSLSSSSVTGRRQFMVLPLTRNEATAVGVVGAGRMGGAIARHLLAAGTSVAVFDPSDEAVAPLVELGAARAASAAEGASRSDLVLVVVVDDEQVRQAGGDALGAAPSGAVVGI